MVGNKNFCSKKWEILELGQRTTEVYFCKYSSTHREILLNQTEIRLYFSFDLEQNGCCQIVNTIWFRFDLIRFFCVYYTERRKGEENSCRQCLNEGPLHTLRTSQQYGILWGYKGGAFLGPPLRREEKIVAGHYRGQTFLWHESRHAPDPIPRYKYSAPPRDTVTDWQGWSQTDRLWPYCYSVKVRKGVFSK